MPNQITDAQVEASKWIEIGNGFSFVIDCDGVWSVVGSSGQYIRNEEDARAFVASLTAPPASSDAQVEALADAVWQLLDDMGRGGREVSGAAKAKARLAFEAFNLDPHDGLRYSLEDAVEVLISCDEMYDKPSPLRDQATLNSLTKRVTAPPASEAKPELVERGMESAPTDGTRVLVKTVTFGWSSDICQNEPSASTSSDDRGRG